jgi:excisionase family DNA binding protein
MSVSTVEPVSTDNWRDRTTITVPEAAAVLGIARNTAYQAAKSGELPVIPMSARLLVPVAALKRLIGEVS